MRLFLALASIAACGSNHGTTTDGPGSGGRPCDHAIATQSCWTTTPDPSGAAAVQFAGGAYDGHFVYFAPFVGLGPQSQYVTSGAVARYDTGADFASASARETFDTTAVDANAQGFRGAVFDGRYVYFIPYQIGQPFGGAIANNGVIARFDAAGSFAETASWAAFDVQSVSTGGAAFRGAVFDGRYLYLPEAVDSVVRYDTTTDLAAQTSWTRFDAAIATSSPALAMDGAVFDGRYVYFVPGDATTVAARYYTTADFASATSWEAFDVRAVSSHAQGFVGGAFDGRYLYLAPSLGAPIVRYDTASDFATAASWSTFDPSPLAAGTISFQGAGFDGRYVYFVPTGGQVIAFDTSGDFASASAWSSFDTRALDPDASDYFGAVFDGRYMYFPPSSITGPAARFDASAAGAEPALPEFHGSFY